MAEDDDVTDLTARIEKYRRWTEANAACFTSLVGEAATITAQVARLKAEVTALATDSAGSDKAKLPRWYARWLIASRALELTHLGHGFTSVSAYSDCLCTTLQCIASGVGRNRAGAEHRARRPGIGTRSPDVHVLVGERGRT